MRVHPVLDALHSAIRLCQWNSQYLNPEESPPNESEILNRLPKDKGFSSAHRSHDSPLATSWSLRTPSPSMTSATGHTTSQVGDFGADNQAGISRTLHQISAIHNRKGRIIGLTCRVGRAVPGSANLLQDLVKDGGPYCCSSVHRVWENNRHKRVMIVDTSNEIGGDGNIPRPGIGNARRLQVPNQDMQHKVLIEAVKNHMPQAIVIDEIGTKLEAMAASTIAQRGIQLVATAKA
uniref:Uncharacterized protein n=1 Tax=Leersia perrieri TaxID=77586 RepID=A0A0D9WM36_9ORYZ